MESAQPTAPPEPWGGLSSDPELSRLASEGEESPDPLGPPDVAVTSPTAGGAAGGVARSASASIMARPTLAPSTVSELEPTQEELRISARILLHIARQPRFAPRETASESLTQAGMAAALGTSQSGVSNALQRLVDGGALQVQRSHVRKKMQRLKVYQLTDHGESLVRQIRESMGP